MKAVGLFILLMGSWAAHAGVGAHGGNTVICTGEEAVTLDYYNASLPTVGGPADIVDIRGWNQDQIVEFVRSRFEGSLFQQLFDEAMMKFGPLSSWPLASLKDVDDGGEPYFLPDHCKRVTGAVRDGNTIFIDPTIISQLSEAQRGLLYVHEMLYWISGENSSAPVREMLRTLLRQSPSASEIATAVQLVGPYYGYQFLKGQTLHTWEEGIATGHQQNLRIYGGKGKSPILLGQFEDGSLFYGTSQIDCRDLTVCHLNIKIERTDHRCTLKVDDLTHLTISCPTFSSGKTEYRFLRLKLE
ncbi:MAG: hypothetical protein AB7G93_05595 [Bdellovibrionales bacterium]